MSNLFLVADGVLVTPHFEVKFVALACEASALPALSMRCCMMYTCPNMVVRQCQYMYKTREFLMISPSHLECLATGIAEQPRGQRVFSL